ncbi:MAG: hypothetical protein IJ689_03670 [Alphaproteobacteria bacterium]|nr:hypothetical protein [Alphaproteobacteria bacterium]
MKRSEKFKIWDATKPKIGEVKAYLNRLCGKTQLQLVYYDPQEQHFYFTNTIDKEAQFVGILIEDTIFHVLGFSRNTLYGECGDILLEHPLCVGDINHWCAKQMFFGQRVRLLNEDDYRLLEENEVAFHDTLGVLEYHEVSMPACQRFPCRFGKNPASSVCRMENASFQMRKYLEEQGDFWFCSNRC